MTKRSITRDERLPNVEGTRRRIHDYCYYYYSYYCGSGNATRTYLSYFSRLSHARTAENTYSNKLGTTRSFFECPKRSRRIGNKLISVPKTEKLTYTTINARKLPTGQAGWGGVLRMQRPHWLGRVTWRASLWFRSIFRELNLFDSADLSYDRPSTTSYFKPGPFQMHVPNSYSSFSGNNRLVVMEIKKIKGERARDAGYRLARTRACDGGYSFMEQTRNVNSAPSFDPPRFVQCRQSTPLNLTYFSYHCCHKLQCIDIMSIDYCLIPMLQCHIYKLL